MLTVKYVGPNGNESIEEARCVNYATPELAQTSNNKVLYCETERGLVTFDNGTVYVMNRDGKTVAVYHLTQWNENAPLQVNGALN